MTKSQDPFDVSVAGGKVLTGVSTEYDAGKVDRKFQFFWSSFKTKSHCETCTTGTLSINVDKAEFPAEANVKFGKDLDFACPPGQVLQGIDSKYKDNRKDEKWKLKCAPVVGSEVTDGGKAGTAKCGEALVDDTTATEESWYVECPRNEVITGIVSKWDVQTLDRTYQFKCGKFDKGSKLRLTGAINYFPKDPADRKWTYNAGADTGITAIQSNYQKGQRTFKFFGSTFHGPEKCDEIWVKPQVKPQLMK